MQPEMLLVTALCSPPACPLSQVEAGSAAEGKHLVLLDCAETILTMSLQPVQPEILWQHCAHWVTVLCHR